MSKTPSHLLEIHAFSLQDSRFPEAQRKNIIENFNCCLSSGQICGLIGPNGAGKSAIFNMFSEILYPSNEVNRPFEILGGKIRFNTSEFVLLSDRVLNLDPKMTMFENLRVWKDRGSDHSINHGFFDHLIRSLDLQPYQDQKVGRLSDGLMHKVEIACALLLKPKLLLIDEPCKFLDGRSSSIVQALIRQMARENGTAVLVASRRPEVIRSLCDRVIVLRDGKILLDSSINTFAKIKNKKGFL